MAPSEDGQAGRHTPVLYQQVLSALRPSAGSRYIDGTVGAGGHAFGILEASAPEGQLLAIDRDKEALEVARRRLAPFGDRVHLRHGSFENMRQHVQGLGWASVHGVLLDLGLSSMQLADGERGFSFQRTGPLDMRFDRSQGVRAVDLINNLDREALADLIYRYGEEHQARRIAEAIVAARPLETTEELAHLVMQALKGRRGRIHPATQTFQALRIAVNDELSALRQGLEQAVKILEPGGRLVVIAFHSLEDRIVKRYLRRETRECICPPEQPICTCDHEPRVRLLTRSPIRPDQAEREANPRSRSARLRAAERINMA
jgi:16S rRNA (cytosine1402-N4)-methyltransferase